MGSRPHHAQGNAVTVSPSATDFDQRPLAPAPLPVLAGVVALGSLLLVAAAQLGNDWAKVFAALAVLAGAAVVLDRSGRARAEREPHPLYRPDKLPTERSVLKYAVVAAVLAALLIFAAMTATPESFGSPLPYFFAAGFLYVVLPQLLARRIVRRHAPHARHGRG